MLLGNLEVEVLDKDIGILVNEVVLLEGASDDLVLDYSVVEAGGTSGSLFFVVELEESVAILLICLLVGVDDCLEDVVAKPFDVLVKIQLVEVLWQVANIN